MCEPAVSAVVAHVALRTLPVPVTAAALQPAIAMPLSVNWTDPVGALPVTVAVIVTGAPTDDGFGVAAMLVVVAVFAAVLDAVVARAVFE